MPETPPSEHEQERIERLRRAMYSRGLSEKLLQERPRHELGAEQSIVGEEWKEEKDEGEQLAGITVAPRYIGLTRTMLRSVLWIAIVAFLMALGFLGYFFTLGPGSLSSSASNVDISVSGPPQIAGGSATELLVSVTNRNTVPLQQADLVITFPPGTRSATDYATDLPSMRIPLDTIEPGGTREGTIKAVFAGQGNAQTEMKLQLEYHVNGSNAVFVAPSTYPLSFGSSPLSISIDGNSETISGQPNQFTVNVMSSASAPQHDVLLHIDYPFGYTFTSAAPAPNVQNNTWYLGDMQPGETRSVQLIGTVSGDPGDARIFRISAGTRTDPKSSDISAVLASNAYALKISQTFLGLSVTVGSSDAQNATPDDTAVFTDTGSSSAGADTESVVAPGSTENVTISYVNNLSSAITDAVIVARLSGTLIDGSTVHSGDGFYRSSDGVVLWDKSTSQGKLATIAPGERGSVSFSFRVPESASSNGVPHVDISVNAAGKRTDATGVPQSLQSAVVKKVQIATNLQLFAGAIYAQSGPMPPKAESETAYAVQFHITNTTNTITDAKITAHLPAYVRWAGTRNAAEAANISFNQANSTVTWNVGDIQPGTGVNGNGSRDASFVLGFTPSTSQIGQSPVILDSIQLTGTDAATGQQIVIDSSSKQSAVHDITTNLSDDPNFDPVNATVVK